MKQLLHIPEMNEYHSDADLKNKSSQITYTFTDAKILMYEKFTVMITIMITMIIIIILIIIVIIIIMIFKIKHLFGNTNLRLDLGNLWGICLVINETQNIG